MVKIRHVDKREGMGWNTAIVALIGFAVVVYTFYAAWTYDVLKREAVAKWIDAHPNMIHLMPSDIDIDIDIGRWGDSFGVLNCLFAIIGSALVIWNLRLTHIEMAKEEEEREKSKKEREQQRDTGMIEKILERFDKELNDVKFWDCDNGVDGLKVFFDMAARTQNPEVIFRGNLAHVKTKFKACDKIMVDVMDYIQNMNLSSIERYYYYRKVVLIPISDEYVRYLIICVYCEPGKDSPQYAILHNLLDTKTEGDEYFDGALSFLNAGMDMARR